MKTKGEPMQNSPKKHPPATTLEARKNLMISLSMDLVEKTTKRRNSKRPRDNSFPKTWLHDCSIGEINPRTRGGT